MVIVEKTPDLDPFIKKPEIHISKVFKKQLGFAPCLTGSIHVTEHALHTCNELLRTLKFTIQKH